MARRERQERKPSEAARDRVLIGRLYLAGKTQVEIAQLVHVAQPTVSRELKQLQGEWQKLAVQAIDEAKGKELAKLDRLELEYWDAWERSKQKFKRSSVTRRGAQATASGAPADELTIVEEERVGDARFLQGVLSCIERRCKVLGIDSPEKLDLSSLGEKVKGYMLVSPDDWPSKKHGKAD